MSRYILGNTIGSDPSFVKSIEEGGTSASTYNQASQELNYPLKETIGFAQGPAPLDPNGYVPSNMIPTIILTRTGVQISGPLTIGIGLQGTYTITNYDSTKTYTVSAVSGTATISGNTITYTAPLQTGSSGIVVNGVTTFITVIDPANNPQVSGPTSLLENQTGTYTITNYDPNSVYNVTISQGFASQSNGTITVTAPPGDGIHNINVTLSVNSLQLVITVQAPPVPTISGPTSFPINTAQTFTITNYTAPCTYNVSVSAGTFTRSGANISYTAPNAVGNYTITVNGSVYSFSTTLPAINQPSVVSPVNAATNLGPTVNFTASAFSISSGSDTQRASNWQLATDPGFTNVIQSTYNDSTNLTTWGVNNLAANTTFYIRVQYIGNSGSLSPYSNATVFSTKVSYTPTQIVSRISSNVANGSFGISVSLNAAGTVALVGSNSENSNVGAAYVFTTSDGVNWTQAARLSSGVSSSNYGYCVSLNGQGNVAAVGANLEGALYIYNSSNSSTWNLAAKISSFGTSYFAQSVSLNSQGNIILIGSIGENSYTGAAYIYSTSNGTSWNQVARITSNVSGSDFGASVSLNLQGNIAIIGADSENSNAGAAYIYSTPDGTNWNQIARLSSNVANSGFGRSVSMNAQGNVVIIGASGLVTAPGSAYIYSTPNGTAWNLVSQLFSNLACQISIGQFVSINAQGNIALVGARDENSYAGAVYILSTADGVNWTQNVRLSSNIANSSFGASVALNAQGNLGMIGAFGENSTAGAAYIVK